MNRLLVRYLITLVYTSLVVLVYYILYKKPLAGIDDANIYFVYVRNFFLGNGFVFHPTGEHVEGFTSMLWVLTITPFYFAGMYFELAVLTGNIALVSCIFLRGINFINRLTEQRSFFSIPAALFILTLTLIPGYIDWSVLTLMETGLWSFLLVMITILLCKENIVKRDLIWFSLYLALLVVTRPESI